MKKVFESEFIPLDVQVVTKPCILEGGIIHTVTSKLGDQFIQAGAKVKGNKSIFPAVFSNGQIHVVTYQLRNLCITQSATVMPYNGKTLGEMIAEDQQNLDFWQFVNMPSRPHFWGSAAIVITEEKNVLLGKKKGGNKTHGGTHTPPAGIVDFSDIVNADLISNGLNNASIREFNEETGVKLTEENWVFNQISAYWDIERNKAQAFSLFVVKEAWLKQALEDADTPIEAEFEENSLKLFSLSEEKGIVDQLSSEGRAAFSIASSL